MVHQNAVEMVLLVALSSRMHGPQASIVPVAEFL